MAMPCLAYAEIDYDGAELQLTFEQVRHSNDCAGVGAGVYVGVCVGGQVAGQPAVWTARCPLWNLDHGLLKHNKRWQHIVMLLLQAACHGVCCRSRSI
eukprot:931790-Prymnesium_polylepis.2